MIDDTTDPSEFYRDCLRISGRTTSALLSVLELARNWPDDPHVCELRSAAVATVDATCDKTFLAVGYATPPDVETFLGEMLKYQARVRGIHAALMSLESEPTFTHHMDSWDWTGLLNDDLATCSWYPHHARRVAQYYYGRFLRDHHSIEGKTVEIWVMPDHACVCLSIEGSIALFSSFVEIVEEE